MPCDFDPQQPVGGSPLAPAATISPQEIAEMRERWARVVGDVPVGALDKSDRGERPGGLIGADIPRLLDAIEALTAFRTDALDTFRAIGLALGLPDPLAADAPADCPAEWNGKLSEKVAAVVAEREALTAKNQRLTDALNTTALEACEEIDDRLKPEIERLRAENARLREINAVEQVANLRRAFAHQVGRLEGEREALKAEVERLTDKMGKYAMPPWEADACKREAMAARRALCLGEHNPNVAPADIYDRIVALRTANETRREDVR